MALIVCEECGGKISDTVSVCIHCGAPVEKKVILQPEDMVIEPVQIQPLKTPAAPAEKKEEKYNYDKLNKDIRMQYELQFLESCDWAKKYRKSMFDIQKFKSLFATFFGMPYFAFFAMFGLYFLALRIFEGVPNIFEDDAKVNDEAMKVYILGLVAIMAISAVARITMGIVDFANKRSWKKYAYIKKYQQWLAEEKNVQYSPIFADTKARERFESVDLDNLYL